MVCNNSSAKVNFSIEFRVCIIFWFASCKNFSVFQVKVDVVQFGT